MAGLVQLSKRRMGCRQKVDKRSFFFLFFLRIANFIPAKLIPEEERLGDKSALGLWSLLPNAFSQLLQRVGECTLEKKKAGKVFFFFYCYLVSAVAIL